MREDLKMVNVLLDQLSEYTKYPCFICFWDRSRRENNGLREKKNVIAEELVDRVKIILPHLNLHLGLMKQFVKALNKEGGFFDNICRNLPMLCMEKLNACIFWRSLWCIGNYHRKWTQQHEFNSWMRLFAFYIVLILLGKV